MTRETVAYKTRKVSLMSDSLAAVFPIVPCRAIKFTYTNHRGETAERRASVMYLSFGKTEWHPEEQAFIQALDIEKGEHRSFAIKNMSNVRYDDEF